MRIAGIDFAQVAFVVQDIDEQVRRLDAAVGSGEWTVYELNDDAFRRREFRGSDGSFTLRHALSWRGDTQYELCQPLAGPSVWQEHLDAGLPGLHHVGAYVDDLDAASAVLAAHGWVQVQVGQGFGATGDGEFRYFEHPGAAFLTELISAPTHRRPAYGTIRTETLP